MNTFLLCLGLLLGVSESPANFLSEDQYKVAEEIVALQDSADPTPPEYLVALAKRESNLATNPPMRGEGGYYGTFQINCDIWGSQLHAKLGIKKCKRDLRNRRTSVRAALYVLDVYRKKYGQCKGQNVYECFIHGQSWNHSTAACRKACAGKAHCSCNRNCKSAQRILDTAEKLRVLYPALFHRPWVVSRS